MMTDERRQIWRELALFLAGIVLAGAVAWFTHVRDAVRTGDLQPLRDEVTNVAKQVVRLTVQLEEREKREQRAAETKQ